MSGVIFSQTISRINEPLPDQNQVYVYPNPTKEFIQIKLSQEFLNKNILIQILDKDGKILNKLRIWEDDILNKESSNIDDSWIYEDDILGRKYQGTLNDFWITEDHVIRISNTTTTPISVKELPEGTYWIHLISEKQKKIIKLIKK